MIKFYKILLILFCFSVSIITYPLYASQTYNIQTQYGEEQVVIPDGYSVEDVLLKVSKAYYEQNHEFKDLQKDYSLLIETSEDYVEKNKYLREKYDDLIKDYDILIKRLETYNKLGFIKGFTGAHYSKGIGNDDFGFGINAGVIIMNKAIIEASANYPWSFTVGLSYLFN